MTFSRHQLAQRTTLDAVDLEEVHRCRRAHNQLGFAYQVGFVRLLNRFPKQEPFEVLDELLLFTGVQLVVATNLIDEYRRRRQTISEHQQRITRYRGLRHFAAEERQRLVAFVFDAASRLEQTSSLHKRAEAFLAEQLILRPSEATIARLVGEQRQRARDRIVDRVVEDVSRAMASRLDTLLVVGDGEAVSPIQAIKSNPGHPSVESMRVAVRKLRLIEETGVLALDLSWLSNNYQRAFFHKVRKSSAHRLREVKEPMRWAVLACFLWQSHGDAVDHVVVMFSKLMTKMERKADDALEEQMGQHKRTIRAALGALARSRSKASARNSLRKCRGTNSPSASRAPPNGCRAERAIRCTAWSRATEPSVGLPLHSSRRSRSFRRTGARMGPVSRPSRYFGI